MSTTLQDQPRNETSNPSEDFARSVNDTAKRAKSSWDRLHVEIRRTTMFVIGALIFLGITGFLEFSNRPAPIQEYGKVGEQFYDDFTDPTLAKSLEVFVFDAEQVKPLDFRVEQLDNGRWVIPSHHSYPADAQDQLAKTAASIIGITRGAMVTRWEADHGQYGVVNPKQDKLSVDEVEGVGKRIILRGEDDSVLADYIVGNEVEGESGSYYVRHPEEDEVYIAKLDIDLSTKFTDWIETDLLDLDSWDIREVAVNDYSFDELKGNITKRDMTTLSRESSGGDWKMYGLNEETEKIDDDAMRDTINELADLKISGVRPKQKGLTPDLKLDRKALKSQKHVDRLQSDLLTRGFLLQPGENDDQENLKLVAREGEISTATEDGLVYRLYFGRAFAGSQEELEIGLSSVSESKDEKDKSESEESNSDSDEGESDDKESADEEEEEVESNKPGRYLFVQVDFDKKYLGDEPVKPTEPEKPAELEEAGDQDTEAKDAESKEKSDESEEPKPEKDSSDKSESDAEDEEDPLAKIRKEYEEAKKKYDDDLKEYEREKEDYDKKITDGKEKADELSRRFADWYYVIPGDSFEKLSLARADIVKPKKDEEKDTDDSDDETAASNQSAADEFLAENKSKEGITTTDSGLQYEVITEGEGKSPQATSRVKVKYKGTLLDGTVFDESGEEGTEFGVDQVIKGWTEALQLMKPGAKWKLYIPPDLAYGESGSGDKIGPNSMVIFEVELLSFK